MTQRLKSRAPHDRLRIDIRQYHEIDYWTERFGCTKEQLLDAVKRVGNSAEAVRKALGKLTPVRT